MDTASTAQPEATGEAAGTTATSNENATPAATASGAASAAATGEEGGESTTGEEGAEAAVAEVKGQSYASLQAAIDAAQAGDTVQLLADVADCGSITISKNITLEGNGHTISGNSSINVNMPGNADADVTIHNVIFKDIANGNKLSAFYFSQVKGKLTITDCTFDSIEYEAIQVTPAPGAVINISNNMFKAKADGTQVRHIHIEMAYGSGFDYEGENINLTVTDNQLHGTVSGDASMGIWWVGTDSTLKVDGNYMEHPETVSITLTNSGVRYNRGDLIYPARSNANVDVDDLMPVAIVAEQASGESKIHACNTLAEAIAAAKDGQTVTLLADATEDVVISKSITLDLGGKTLTNTNAGKATISVQGGTVTVKNGNVVGGTGYYNIEVTKGSNANLTLADVTATAGNNGSAMIDNHGTLTITSGTYTGGLDTVKNEPNAKLTITGGAFTLTKGTSKGFTGVVFNYGDLTINGGEFIQSDKSAPYGQAQVVHTDKSGNAAPSTVISGGTFKNLCTRSTAWTVRATNAADGATKVSDGTFNKSIPDYYCADGFIPTKNADGTYGVKEGSYVAQVGSKKYETLADAIRPNAKGTTITLLTDVEQNSQLTIGKSITLNLNGKTIKNTQGIWGEKSNAILSITNGAKVTITGDGTIDAKENDCYTINVVKGDLTIENGTFYGNVSVVQVEEGTLSVKGGTFDLHQKWEGSSKYLFNCIDDAYASGSAKVAISGGTFVGFDPSASPEGEGTSYLAPGYAPADNGDGTYGVVAGVAQVAGKAFNTLQAAINAAESDETIQLLADTTENVTIDATKQITLDLNGHTLNGGTGAAKATILNKGNVTITDTSADKTGTIKRDDQGVEGETSYYVIRNIGTMVIDQANVENNSGYKKANPSGSMVGSSLICNGDDDPQASLTINGGTFKQMNFLVVKNGSNGTLTVNGGTLTSNHSAVQNWNKAQILGGTLTGQIWTDTYDESSIGETVIGGDAQFAGEIVVDAYRSTSPTPTLKIEGGSLNVTKWRVTDTAVEVNATVAVSGGTFKAAVPENYCAAGYAPVDNGNGTYGVKLPEGAYALQDYRSGDHTSWTYPTQDGKAFAGWYKDAAFTNPCTANDVEGAAYAKFVSITDLLQFKGGSLRMDKGEAVVSTDLRFGYTKAIPEGATYISNGWYIKSLEEGSAKDDCLEASNNVLNNDGTVTSNLVLIDVPKNCYKLDFTEKAFVKYVTVDGTTVEAVESQYQSRSVSAVADAILHHPMASQHEKQYANDIKSAIQ